MIRLYKNLGILFLTLFVGACSDEFLEFAPIATPSTESFYTNYESLDYSSTAAYGILCSRDIYDIMYTIGFQSVCDDSEVGGENVNDWSEFQRMDRLIHTSSEDRVHRMWAYPYKGIRMTNEVLLRAEEIRSLEMENANNDSEAQAVSDLIDARVAEMHFLRAFYHFTLMQIYGGVPIMDYKLDDIDQTVPRNSIAEVLHFIQDELLLAIPILSEKSELDAENIGRATKGAAKALLAKAYLYESSYAKNYADDYRFTGCKQKYNLALQYAEEVMNSGEYHLVGIDGERFASWRVNSPATIGGYRWIFTLDADNCDESIWEIQNLQDGWGWTLSRGNYITVYTTVRFCYEADGTTAGQSAGGWSFNLPTKYLVNAFGNNDTRETGLNSTPMAEDLDPRFSTTVGREGDSVLVNTGKTTAWFKMDFQNLPTNTISRKYECSPEEYWNDKFDFHDGPMNIRLIRYADLVLMAAEAAFEEGDNAKALNYVNKVRKRARMSGETGFPADLTAVSFEDIVHERRLELAMEQSRLFDLVRWNLAETFIDGTTLDAMGDGFIIDFEKGKHEFFPIPELEIQKVNGLEQYDAWK